MAQAALKEAQRLDQALVLCAAKSGAAHDVVLEGHDRNLKGVIATAGPAGVSATTATGLIALTEVGGTVPALLVGAAALLLGARGVLARHTGPSHIWLKGSTAQDFEAAAAPVLAELEKSFRSGTPEMKAALGLQAQAWLDSRLFPFSKEAYGVLKRLVAKTQRLDREIQREAQQQRQALSPATPDGEDWT